ncbi:MULTISPECIES: DUF3551 domain-containing protein [unclassified Bradyrhizobium]|uniref:DUF3551 domain-containing protein n=1 Tax=unclassified Bradyrhizobium TaxID=2631580 RepID=UPI000A057AE6|nr:MULTISPECIES: DUF3551 domain-containing protein [unclassified Bradyrhizobium]QIG98205.1 DUF3551 domain-containing protein [Bradyrhizobium sp. 6(2017)]
MRQVQLAGLSVIGLLAIASPAAANDRYCLQGREWGYPGNCEFSTYSQCTASASGTDAYCGINPQYAYRGQRSGHTRAY